MNLLFVNLYQLYTHDSLLKNLTHMGYHVCDKTYYTPKDFYHDEILESCILKDIQNASFDVVFTINYWPLVASVCHTYHIPYISWSYDSPMNLTSMETMDYPENFIFIFDKIEYLTYKKKGLHTVYHLPLAADCIPASSIHKSVDKKYDISFVGSLYQSNLPELMQPMSAYNKGYLQAIIAAQKKIYGYYLVDEMLSDELLLSIHSDYLQASSQEPSNVYMLSKEELSYSIATQITHLDRITLLSLLSKHFHTALASDPIEKNLQEFFSEIDFLGRVSYQKEMPQLFMDSKINLNPILRAIRSGIPLRALDILSCGGFLLSSYQPELAESFIPDQEVVLYDSMEDALAKADFYLKHNDLREKIAINGYQRIRSDFQYSDRLHTMMQTAGIFC